MADAQKMDTSPLTISLAPDLQGFIAEKIKSGEYATAEEVIGAGLSLLKQQFRADNFDPGELAALIAEGEKSIASEGLVSLKDSFDRRRQRRTGRRGKIETI